MSSPIYQAIKQISDEKNISVESVIETIEAALAAAYNKDFGDKRTQNVKVTFDAESGNFDVFDVKTVVEDQELPPEPEPGAEPLPPAPPVYDELGNLVEEKKFNPKTEVMITAAQELKGGAQIGEEIRTQLEVPSAFGRMAAQTAKQVITQKLREAERNMMFSEFKDKEHQLVNATVQRKEGRMVVLTIDRATAVMPPEEQIATERYNTGDRVKVYIIEVRMTSRGPEIIASRSHPNIIRELFTIEIPEVAAGTVLIHAVAREAGSRSKVAVSSTQDNIDPIGSCIGQRGTRIQTIISELGGEKIDIIQFEADMAKFIANSLSPAKVQSITLNETERSADVLVNEDQLSLAIGKGGQNVRLASRLTGLRINIREANKPEVEGTIPADEIAAESESASATVPADEAASTSAADNETNPEESGESAV